MWRVFIALSLSLSFDLIKPASGTQSGRGGSSSLIEKLTPWRFSFFFCIFLALFLGQRLWWPGPSFFSVFFFDRRPWRIYERSFCCRPRSKRKPIFLPLAWSLLAAHSVPLFISPPWKNRPTNWATSFQLVLSSFYRFFFLDFILIHLPNRPERYYLVICLFRSRYTSCYCFLFEFYWLPCDSTLHLL